MHICRHNYYLARRNKSEHDMALNGSRYCVDSLVGGLVSSFSDNVSDVDMTY